MNVKILSPQQEKSNKKEPLTQLIDNKNKRNLLLLLILIVAAYLRYQGVRYGLPYVLNQYESNYFIKLFYVFKHFLNPSTILVPHFFLYLNALVVSIVHGTIDVNTMLSRLEVSPESFYIPLRLLSVLFGLGGVIVTYFIGSTFSSLVGIFASGFLAVAFLHIKYSQMFLPFSAMTFFSLLATFFSIKAFIEKSRYNLILSVLFSSLSTSMHYIGFVSFVPTIFVLALNKTFSYDKSQIRYIFSLFLILFFILNPYLIFYLFSFLLFLIKSYITSYNKHHSGSYLLYIFNFLILGVGPVVWVSALALLKYKKDYDLHYLKILFSLPFLYLGFLGFFHLTEGVYGLLLVPYVCLASGLTFNSLYTASMKVPGTSAERFLFIVLLLFAIWVPLKYSLKYNKIINLFDTRVIASEWIKENTNSDFKIAYDKNSIQISWFDPYRKVDLKGLSVDPDALVNKQKFIISQKLLQRKDWFKILRKKVDYVVINSLDFENALRRQGDPLKKKFYTQILKLKPALTFNPYLLEKEKDIRSSLVEELYSPFETLWYRERAGPIIKIYKL